MTGSTGSLLSFMASDIQSFDRQHQRRLLINNNNSNSSNNNNINSSNNTVWRRVGRTPQVKKWSEPTLFEPSPSFLKVELDSSL